jgi:hypothetical protein
MSMARKDMFHEAVRTGLEKEKWTITHDPYVLMFGEQKLQVDLGAEMPVAAERAGRKIAVEIKSFISASAVTDLYAAIGQYMVYRSLMQKSEPERTLYLAIPNDAFYEVFDPAHGRDLRQELEIRLMVYEAEEETILQWIE